MPPISTLLADVVAFAPTDVISMLGNLRVIGLVTALVAGCFLVVGAASDVRRLVRQRQMDELTADLSVVLFGDEEIASEAAEQFADVATSVLLPVLQGLAADLDGKAGERLRNLIAVTGMTPAIVRRLTSRRWRRRAQAASLCSLLPEGDARRTRLLTDRHPLVRARAAEHLDRDDVVGAAPTLLALLDDPSDGVRFASQHALLQGDDRIVASLAEYLRRADGPGVVRALEVAAVLHDARLLAATEPHLTSDSVARRAIAARALTPAGSGLDRIAELLVDREAEVRSAAVAAAAGPGGEALAAVVGRLLGDRSWIVRRQAGHTLAAMGPTGALVLRAHLSDTDPYARDMARHTLDDLEALGARAVSPATIPRGIDTWSAATESPTSQPARAGLVA